MNHPSPLAQRGAALAVALLMLVIIILLGVAAVRATQVELRLAQNAESRMAAIQAADSIVAFVGRTPANLPVDGEISFVGCVRAANVSNTLFGACPSGASAISLVGSIDNLGSHGYALVRREAPLFVEANVLREAQLSAKNYDFARFTITGGYDRSGDRMGVAEVVQGTLKLHTKTAGMNYE